MKQEKPIPVRAEVIDHVISLHMGENVYKSFFKGAIVDIEPITFRNLEKKGRVKMADYFRGPSAPEAIGRKKRKTKVVPPEEKTASPEGNAV